MFLRFTSHKFRQPISVDMYHPLNEVAENCIPPQSNNILLTAGNAYHLKLSSLNHSNLKSGEEKGFDLMGRVVNFKNCNFLLTLGVLMELQELIPGDIRNSLDRYHSPIGLREGCPILCLYLSIRVFRIPVKLVKKYFITLLPF